MRHKCMKVAGAILAAAFVQVSHAEAGSSCIINPGTPTTYASVAFNAVSPFDSVVAPVAMCLPSVFSVFDSRFMTLDFAEFDKFRSDEPKGFMINFR